MAVVIKKPNERHHTKRFGSGSFSHRIILPGKDNCPLKETEFYVKAGYSPGRNVVHKTHERVYVLWGQIKLKANGRTHELTSGSTYFTPAGEPTTMTAVADSCLRCTFFPAEGGPLPDDK